MEEIDQMLEKWIYNSIIRAKLRGYIIDYAQTAFQEGRGEDGFGDYN